MDNVKRVIAAPGVLVFNNMVTPYTCRLFNEVFAQGNALRVASCVAQENNRSWLGAFQTAFPHELLPGITLKVGTGRFAHINLGVWRAVRGMRPSVIVINGFYPTMLYAAVAGWITRTPLVLMVEGWGPSMPRSPYHAVVRPLIVSLCSSFIVCGKKGKTFFLSCGVPAERVFISRLVPAWNPPAIKPGFADRPYDVLWAAHMNSEVKNVPFFLRVIQRVYAEDPQLTIRLVGDGPMAAAVAQQLAHVGVSYRIDKSITPLEMQDVYQSAKVLLLPSIIEPWGLVVTEAMSCGVPCIVSDKVGAAGDLVVDAENGRVVPLIEESWVSAVLDYLRDERAWEDASESARTGAASHGLGDSVTQFCAGVNWALVNGKGLFPSRYSHAPA